MDDIKQINICIIGVAESFLNQGKEIDFQVLETQIVLNNN